MPAEADTTVRILALDPGISATGYAVAESRGGGIELIESGLLRPKGESLRERGLDLRRLVAAKRDEHWILMGLFVVVVEMPFRQTRGGPKSNRSAMTLPTYGMSVGMTLAGAWREDWECNDHRRLLAPHAGEWSRESGCPGVPIKDEYKTARVVWAERMFGKPSGFFGPKTVAGNVADAALMTDWAWRIGVHESGVP